MDSRLEAHPRHPDWIAHPFLVIHRELLRQDVQYLAIERDRDGARGVDHAIDIARPNLATAHGDDSMTIEAADMRARDSDGHRTDSAFPEVRSASSVAARIASTVASILTTTPLRSPVHGATP